jgi:hypothetical protein
MVHEATMIISGTKSYESKAAGLEYATVFGAAFAIIYLINFRDGIFIWSLSQQEGGLWIDEAYRMINGELIYRDFFDFLGPGVTFLNYLFLWLLGPTTTSVGLMVVTLGAAIAAAVYAVSSAMLSHPWRLVPTAIFVGLNYAVYSPGNHKWPTVLLCSLGILAVLRTRSRLRCWISGVIFGCATWCTQDYGVCAAFGMGLSLWLLHGRERGADPWAFVLGYGATMLTVFVALGLAAGFRAVWYDLFLFLFEQYGTLHLFAIGFGGMENLPIWLSSFGLGMLGLVYAIIGVIRRFWKSDDPSVVILALSGAGLLFGGFVHPIEPIQIGVRAVPLTIVGVYFLQQVVKRRILHPLPLVSVIAVGIIVVWHAVSVPVGVQYSNPRHLEEHRAGKIWATRQQQDVSWLEANTVEGQPVFLFPDKGGLYFLTRTRNATSYPFVFDMGFTPEGQIRDAIRQLDSKCPQIGIWHWNRLASFAAGRPDWFTLKPLWQYIERSYDAVEQFPNGAIGLRRKFGSGCE